MLDKLPDILNEKQKANKVKNILSWLKDKNEVERLGSKTNAIWQLKNR
jgi:hypothetical protein